MTPYRHVLWETFAKELSDEGKGPIGNRMASGIRSIKEIFRSFVQWLLAFSLTGTFERQNWLGIDFERLTHRVL